MHQGPHNLTVHVVQKRESHDMAGVLPPQMIYCMKRMTDPDCAKHRWINYTD